MSQHTIRLFKCRLNFTQREQTAIFIPILAGGSTDPSDPSAACEFTLINVVGAPFTGHVHEIEEDYCCTDSVDSENVVPMGFIWLTEERLDAEAIAKAFETVALQLPAPSRDENFLAPVNDMSSL